MPLLLKSLLQEVYPFTNNKAMPIPLSDTDAYRLIKRHSGNGFAIVSACRGCVDFNLDENNPSDKMKLANINAVRTKEMVELIQSNGFSYTLTYGGFVENQGTENEEIVFEESAIIYPEKRNGELDVKGMYNLALEICNKYHQDSICIKMPNGNPAYITKDGSTDREFSVDVIYKDLLQEHFTDLHKNITHKITDKSRPTRFTFLEAYIAPKPQCYSESHVRWLKGERFLKK